MLKIYLKLLQKYRPSAGWSLAELMISAAMTLVVVMVAGFGLIMILRENKVANATGEMQYDLNRATEFIAEEIRSAKTIETNMNDIRRNAPTFFAKHPDKTPILALKIDNIYERVIYYVDGVEDDEVWRGPGVIRRFGPRFNLEGRNDGDPDESNYEDPRRDPDGWSSLALVDMTVLELNDNQKICRDLPHDPAKSDGVNTYIATDTEGREWFRFPQATADVKGFFSCVREDKQLAQINIVGTTLDEFKHLGYDEEDIRTNDKQTRHSQQMEYDVVTMAHARSEVVGSSGKRVPPYKVTPPIVFEEDGDATLDVLYVNIPCYDNTTSDEVITTFFTSDVDSVGTVQGQNRGPTASFNRDDTANPHIIETRSGGCTSNVTQYQINVRDRESIKFATNDTGNHTKLNDIMPSSSDNFADIVDRLESKGLIREANDGTYDFILPDNIVLYFVEFEFVKDDPIYDEIADDFFFEDQEDSPYFDDAVILVEVTK